MIQPEWIRFKRLKEKWALVDESELHDIINSDLLPAYVDYSDHNYLPDMITPILVKSLEVERDIRNDLLIFKQIDVRRVEKTYRRFLPSSASLYPDNDKEIAKQEISSDDFQNETTEEDPVPEQNGTTAFPCNPRTKWGEIEMALLPAGEKFSVRTHLGRGYYDHIDLKLHDERTKSKRPNNLWIFLKQLAEMDGFYYLDGVQDFELLSSNAKRLDKHLKQLFGIEESIYKGRCNKIGGYETEFKISRISDDDTMDSGKSLIDEELEDPKYNTVKKSSYYPEHSTFKEKE